ncbi:hypothetical protein QVD17_06951 [Tagetes erecta]|uniref:Leucine zipper homeobox-associated domain-containing protein n=1 Tax=Tagetes erecta TaxID=13708 RepID=A0AAD8LKE3_TARER|nr:hypothetical protein QVD17_06951 [Tagetes erecta]
MLERDYNLLKSCYDILTSDYESVSKENENLKAETLVPKEVPETSIIGQDSNSAIQEVRDIPAPLDKIKVDDHFSAGSGESAVVDNYDGLQLLDSGDSYFPDDNYLSEYVVVNVDKSEEDDGSDRGHKHFRYPLETTDHGENDDLSWWVWF